VDGRIVGVITATVALIVLGFVALGLFTSLGGLVIATGVAALAGATAGSLAEPARSARTSAIVVGYVAILILAYLLVGQTASRYAPPGSRGGPGRSPQPSALSPQPSALSPKP
jgi:hypothetical protein